ncbi:hypothetical protein DPMN_142892 [Dreissena polymorpha]|uniref:Uncharacterized protein n=1 Tax=Dreissena polymorpha TaxID=45954 RepID=A0A9D4GBY1_DREPO|nr:hypothetical protein DPMN_142892 [Dreissena polymorpha]
MVQQRPYRRPTNDKSLLGFGNKARLYVQDFLHYTLERGLRRGFQQKSWIDTGDKRTSLPMHD